MMVAMLAGAKGVTNEHNRKAIIDALAWHKRRGLAYNKVPVGKRRIEVRRGSRVYKVDVYDKDDLEVIREIVARRAMNDSWAEIGRELERRHLMRCDGKPWGSRRKKGAIIQEHLERVLKHYEEHITEHGEPKGFTKATAYLEAQRIVSQILGDRNATMGPEPPVPFISS
jgi:hypothetical protein